MARSTSPNGSILGRGRPAAALSRTNSAPTLNDANASADGQASSTTSPDGVLTQTCRSRLEAGTALLSR